MKIDIHSHILPKEWPDLKKVMMINLLNYFWNFSMLLLQTDLFFWELGVKFLCFRSDLKLFGSTDFLVFKND